MCEKVSSTLARNAGSRRCGALLLWRRCLGPVLAGASIAAVRNMVDDDDADSDLDNDKDEIISLKTE